MFETRTDALSAENPIDNGTVSAVLQADIRLTKTKVRYNLYLNIQLK